MYMGKCYFFLLTCSAVYACECLIALPVIICAQSPRRSRVEKSVDFECALRDIVSTGFRVLIGIARRPRTCASGGCCCCSVGPAIGFRSRRRRRRVCV